MFLAVILMLLCVLCLHRIIAFLFCVREAFTKGLIEILLDPKIDDQNSNSAINLLFETSCEICGFNDVLVGTFLIGIFTYVFALKYNLCVDEMKTSVIHIFV